MAQINILSFNQGVLIIGSHRPALSLDRPISINPIDLSQILIIRVSAQMGKLWAQIVKYRLKWAMFHLSGPTVESFELWETIFSFRYANIRHISLIIFEIKLGIF